ncbi:glycosyltransferase family protein [Rhizobium sp. SAFR-030]|uniref:glycosyltransferase family protein n=1 Tax=Rhizobium sp. SAFR-030 TaxID=3387277 RepID=UPI003F81E23B
MTTPRRILFYVQHLLGIGHLVRASRVAQAIYAAGMEVTMVTGGSAVAGFPAPGIRHVALPTILASNSNFSGLADGTGAPVDDAYREQRTRALLEVFETTRPHAVIIEAFPFGRRQMRFELLPLLDAIEAADPRPLLFSSVRDILQENRKPGRDEETADLVGRHFDGVLVHGDPNFVRLDDTFPFAGQISAKVHYTGLVAPEPPVPSADRFDVVVSAGGGAVGAELLEASLGAARILADGRSWCLIAGPNLPGDDFVRLEAMAPDTVTLVRFRPDFPSLLMNAEVSVSQAGYNTVCDLLRAKCAAVLVPFASGGETEQTVRAQKLAALGFAQVVPEHALDSDRLARAIVAARSGIARPTVAVALDGAQQTARLLQDLIDSRSTSGR